jgi:hypothetical protein
MDKVEAKLVLQAVRPKDLEAPPPAIADALTLAQSDPEMKAWWEAQQAFDLKVAEKLNQVPVPEDLRATIFASRKIEQIRPQPILPPAWLAIAAAVAVLCAIGSQQWFKSHGPLPREEYIAKVLPLLGSDDHTPSLGMTSSDQKAVMAWLRDRNAPVGPLPDKMTSLATAGCQEYHVNGNSISVICFMTPSGGVAHLFIVPKSALLDPPPEGSPDMRKNEDGWTTASWSDKRMSYVLATQGGPEFLKELL